MSDHFLVRTAKSDPLPGLLARSLDTMAIGALTVVAKQENQKTIQRDLIAILTALKEAHEITEQRAAEQPEATYPKITFDDGTKMLAKVAERDAIQEIAKQFPLA